MDHMDVTLHRGFKKVFKGETTYLNLASIGANAVEVGGNATETGGDTKGGPMSDPGGRATPSAPGWGTRIAVSSCRPGLGRRCVRWRSCGGAAGCCGVPWNGGAAK